MTAFLARSTIRTLVALVALGLCIAPGARAQTDRNGVIEGAVFDSIHTRLLADAHVVAVGTGPQSEVRREATSDSVGRYHIDSLPLGRYLVGFESALLDSLEITVSPRTATVTPEHVATLDLALPSATKLRSAVCLGAALPAESGVIFGHVVSAETESPLAGVVLAMAWHELGVDRTTLRATNGEHTESVVTDGGGWYRMCGVPMGAWVSMQLQHEGRVGPVLRTRVDDTLGIAIRHLSFSKLSARASEPSDSAAGAPLSGTAMLTGIVRGPGGVPVPSAEVKMRGTAAATLTDSSGAFSLKELPAGTQELEVRRVGYAVAETSVELRSGATTTANVRLQRIVSLDSVRVVASRNKYPEFYAHKEGARMGVFLGPEDLEKQRVSRASDFIEKIPVFKIARDAYHTYVLGNRGVSYFGKACKVNIIIDGVNFNSERDPISIDNVHPNEIAAIEAYREGEPAPPGYDRGCGAVAIWTKR
ncbi:MAG TPA: carboxypeptidase-like regulatory domain-containing protein [Gemmatimonadaceae bacterium]